MMIYLPNDPVLFHQTFDATCDRIIQSEKDETFYILLVELASCLRKHPLFKDFILERECESEKQKQEFIYVALEALEDHWHRIWKYHCHDFNQRKRLTRIKRMITAPNEISYSPLYNRILFALREIRYYSHFCHVANEVPRFFKMEEIEKKFFIRGQNDDEKRKNMHIKARVNPAFCWKRIQFLQECHSANGTFPALAPQKGKWHSIREIAWQAAFERCEIEVLLGAKMALSQKLSSKSSSIDSFLIFEHQIHRKDYEKFLQSLKIHVQNELLRIQDAQATVAYSHSESLTDADDSRIERENFIINHAKKYRAEFPRETHNNMFKAYKKECPRNLTYAQTKWKEIIKDHQLDPRTLEEKKINSGRRAKK